MTNQRAQETATPRFLKALGRIAKRRKARLYYPGAGTDVRSFLLTELSDAVFLDAAYFNARHLTRMDLRRLVQGIDPRARFSDRGRRGMAAKFSWRKRPRRIIFLRGEADRPRTALQRLYGRKFIYLAKGCLNIAILCPPQPVLDRGPVAYGIDLVELPPLSRTIRAFYRDRVFEARRPQGTLRIFQRYDPSPERVTLARQELRALLLHARSTKRRRTARDTA
jgi:hypothetical protein